VEYGLTAMEEEVIPLIDHMREYGIKWPTTGEAASGAKPDDTNRGG
jgi:DNA-binding HxlR family transcriptional regulator